MRKIIMFGGIVLTALLVVSSTGIPLQGAIPPSERAALIALYNATKGDNWKKNSGWKGNNNESDGFSQIGSEGTWYGITVSGDHVTYIWFIDNNLNGSIPTELGKLSNLEGLDLDENELSGSIPPELGSLSNLEKLRLSRNQLSGCIPVELGNLSNLVHLGLDFNKLTGSIPAWLVNLSNLSCLDLSLNQLSGSIPPELGNLGNLHRLALSSNQLSGSIPPDLGSLSNLGYLCLSSNMLRGSIPPELGNLNNLYTLCLNDNQLSGSISPELGNLSRLKYASLSSNQLSGNIPTSLTNLTNLWLLYIRYNCLYTNDPDLREWLNRFDSDWESYQGNQCGGDKDPPFGFFDTPIDASTVCSSIPVTGWALDDTWIDSVKIYRQQGNGLVYIGDAIMVEGARPDVAAAYPGYPNNTKAGWGYMMLTNFLPNSGNGTFVFHAIATDFVGKTTTLGTKTIHCDNANAVKPFGTIDTPTQGGTASGSSFVNWGWVLTPQPNYIPTDGSTIHVFIDSVDIGHPFYNNYREDIATLFPGYANSNGAVGYFYLNTTAYENGVHTIQWTAMDNAGNVDGIGSRYFNILNEGTTNSVSQISSKKQFSLAEIAEIPANYSEHVILKKGYNSNIEPETVYPNEKGYIAFEIKELERIVIHLNEIQAEVEEKGLKNSKFKTQNSKFYSGYLLAGQQLWPLPIGSTMDSEKGIFYWLPGPGFVGEYQFVFIEKGPEKAIHKKLIKMKIIPKFRK